MDEFRWMEFSWKVTMARFVAQEFRIPTRQLNITQSATTQGVRDKFSALKSIQKVQPLDPFKIKKTDLLRFAWMHSARLQDLADTLRNFQTTNIWFKVIVRYDQTVELAVAAGVIAGLSWCGR
jgi:hypothetical protein